MGRGDIVERRPAVRNEWLIRGKELEAADKSESMGGSLVLDALTQTDQTK
jgi:hypothetical protein